MRRAEEKILSWDALGRLAPQWREAGLRVVLTNGCFDLLHVGHLRYLQASRALGALRALAHAVFPDLAMPTLGTLCIGR